MIHLTKNDTYSSPGVETKQTFYTSIYANLSCVLLSIFRMKDATIRFFIFFTSCMHFSVLKGTYM